MQNISKFLSLILRHKPEAISIKLDSQGWASVSDIVIGMTNTGKNVDTKDIISIVLNDEKGRYSLKDNNTMIRANQGHSIKVDLDLKEKQPTKDLFHGTATQFVSIILKEGLKPMQRHHVHLSDNVDTAMQVGSRRGNPHIFTVNTSAMIVDGFKFYQSVNGVWLVDNVPTKYLY